MARKVLSSFLKPLIKVDRTDLFEYFLQCFSAIM